jgi:hypothetical protein
MSGLGMLLVLVGLVLVVTTYTGSTGRVVAAAFGA